MQKLAFFRKGDIVIIAALVLLVLLLTLPVSAKEPAALAIIYKDGEVYREIKLSEANDYEEINLGGPYHIKIEVSEGKIRFSHSDCPDQVCIASGWLSSPGEYAACLPARCAISIKGQVAEGVDFVAN